MHKSELVWYISRNSFLYYLSHLMIYLLTLYLGARNTSKRMHLNEEQISSYKFGKFRMTSIVSFAQFTSKLCILCVKLLSQFGANVFLKNSCFKKFIWIWVWRKNLYLVLEIVLKGKITCWSFFVYCKS